MLVLSVKRSSLGKESSVQESRKTVRMINYNGYWLFCTDSQGELQLQQTADRQECDCQLDFLLLPILCREYGKTKKVPEDFFVLYL